MSGELGDRSVSALRENTGALGEREVRVKMRISSEEGYLFLEIIIEPKKMTTKKMKRNFILNCSKRSQPV